MTGFSRELGVDTAREAAPGAVPRFEALPARLRTMTAAGEVHLDLVSWSRNARSRDRISATRHAHSCSRSCSRLVALTDWLRSSLTLWRRRARASAFRLPLRPASGASARPERRGTRHTRAPARERCPRNGNGSPAAFPVPFRNVVRYRLAGLVEMLGGRQESDLQRVRQPIPDPGDELDCCPVDIQIFMVESPSAPIGSRARPVACPDDDEREPDDDDEHEREHEHEHDPHGCCRFAVGDLA